MTETPILAKFPEDIAKKIREGLANRALPPMGIIKSGLSEVTVDFDGTVLKGKAMQLPCITEVLKTFNQEIYYKCGDISTMFKFTQPENQKEERKKLKVLHEKGIGKTPEKDLKGEDEDLSPKEKEKRLIEKRKREKLGVEMKTIPMDSGLTPPATSIRTEWLQRTPLCECPNQDDYICKKCGYFPKHKVTEVGDWLFSCLHEKPSEKFEIIEVDLDEWEDPGDNETDDNPSCSPSVNNRPRNSQKVNRPRMPLRQGGSNPFVRQQRQPIQFLRNNMMQSHQFALQNQFVMQRPTMPFPMALATGHQVLNPRMGGPRMTGGSPMLNSNSQNQASQFLK